MRAKMMVVLGFGAVTLLQSAGWAQEPWPERREERRDRCVHMRDAIAHDRHEERRHNAEGHVEEARIDHDRLIHERHEYRVHHCADLLRH
jgi:hypothetical protein